MKFKEFKKNIRKEANNIEIENMSEDVSNYAKATSINNGEQTKHIGFGRKQAIVLALCSLAIILLVVVPIVIFGGTNNNILIASNVARPVGSANTLSRLMNKNNTRNGLGWFSFGAKEAMSVDDAYYDEAGPNSIDQSGSAPNGGTSQTISQVEGIQESEIVKCDNNHIYYALRNSVEIYEANNGKATLLKKIELQNKLYYYGDEEFVYDYYFTPIQMYITDNNLILMYEKVIQKNYNSLVRSYWYGFYGNAFETVLQIYDKDEFNLTKEISVPGSLIDGRVYNNFIYFITAENIVDYKIASITETTNGVDDEKEFDYDDVIYVPEYIEYPYENYICSINLNTLATNYECQLGSNSYGTIYMSENALYMCNTCYTDSNPGEVIYKYAINEDGFLKFSASGKVDGYVNNQYYLDEYNGYLRVATTGRFYNNNIFNNRWESEVINALYVLEEKEVYGGKTLEVVGKLDKGIGYPGEQIKSVKFDKEYVSIVTYYQTDPLYLIKFTDNTKIEIVDYLKVPGYSTFLLDISINGTPYKIGVGLTDNRNYKISLYQVVDDSVSQVGKDYVIEVGEFSYDDENNNYTDIYTYTPIVDNIRTMFLYKDNNENTFIGMNLDENTYTRINGEYNYNQVGKYLLLRLDLGTEDTIVLVNELIANSQSARMVVVNGYFYLVSMGEARGYTYNADTKVLDLVE
ncbi:MAG: beta-propeller domain-containing protein [Bacilli bacterium]|nr:beta-propeller domain-containing protein [Bacilli bacterium]